MDCDSVNYMIGLSTNTPFRVQRSTNLGVLAAQARPHENSSVNELESACKDAPC